jgi:hypothetical protein
VGKGVFIDFVFFQFGERFDVIPSGPQLFIVQPKMSFHKHFGCLE